ncbi:hypothetical protein Cpir12675_005639 [Ceratocystis pirilliformis]|uniref:PHD-type domain-containing protein n=1 Tax=Ceratocystis pirilliformis TaxID=259994 RepID=A0ABR3YPH1_9PEZI
MDLDELPSAGLTDAHYENLELFPEVTRADSIASEVPQFDTELVSSNTTASPAAFSTTASQLGDDLSNIAIDPKPFAANKSHVKKKGTGIRKLPNGTGVTSMATKRPKATSGAKTSTTRRPKAKPSSSTSALDASGANGVSSSSGPGGIANGSSAVRDSPTVGDSDDPGTYCLCHGRDDHRWMICCEKCEDWFHGECINLDTEIGESLIEMFICPRCTDGNTLVTRYKKTCSLDGCRKLARSYAPAAEADDEIKGAAGAVEAEDRYTNSVFCSDEHCYQWWEQMVARLTPASTIPPAVIGKLSREDLLGVIASGLGYVDEATGAYKLAHEPFSAPVSKEESEDMHLSTEERSLLSKSADDRAELASEIELCSKMLQLADQVTERHKAAVASGFITNDICGYDSRLDSVGVQAAFAAFLQTEEGHASCTQGTLQAPKSELAVIAEMEKEDDKERKKATAGMCDKKRCKAHQGWAAMLHKAVKNQIRQLTSQTADLLCEEEVVRAASLERYRRKKVEKNWVETVEAEKRVKQEEADKTIGDAMDLD